MTPAGKTGPEAKNKAFYFSGLSPAVTILLPHSAAAGIAFESCPGSSAFICFDIFIRIR